VGREAALLQTSKKLLGYGKTTCMNELSFYRS
jgi:hypothetical protein